MNRVRMLIHFGITPYLVFDGDYLPSKSVTEEERAKRREASKVFGLQLYRAGKIAQAQAELQKAVDVTPEMAGQLIEELRKHNVQFVVAPYEADAQLAYLERKGLIQGVISEDSDLLVFGTRRLLTKLDQYGDCIEVNRDHFTANTSVSLVGWTDADFRRMAILSGCDYLPNVNRLGLKTAYGLVRKFKTTERIVQRLRFDAKYTVPIDYLESFRRAELTFLHQWVFCPEAKKLVMGSPLENCELDSLDFLGTDMDPTVARGVAGGRLHPTSKQQLLVKSIPLRNAQSPWSVSHNVQVDKPISKIGIPIDQYFKNKRVPLAELDPNSFTPSPSQQLLQDNAHRSFLSSSAPNSPLVPTPTRRASASVGPSVRTTTTPLRHNSVPSKRPRLCNDDDDIINAASAPLHTRSRFFTSQVPKPSPLAAKTTRRTAKKDPVNIWSDDSIDEALAELPDLSMLISKEVPIFRDEPAEEPAKVLAPSRTTSRWRSNASLVSEAFLTEKSSTQATSSLFESLDATEGEKEPDLPSKVHATLADKYANLPKTLDLSRFTAAHTAHEGIVPVSPQRTTLIADASVISSYESTSAGSTRTPIKGSEDLLVPQSGDEVESGIDEDEGSLDELDDVTRSQPSLDIGRFMFAG